MEQEESLSFKCVNCSKLFGYKWNLETHSKTCHENKSNVSFIKCPDCQQVIASYKLLKKHVEESHAVVFQEEHLHFPDINAFKAWKEKVEKENLCFYALKATARLKQGKRMYYHCHRSGYFKSRSTGKRRLKSQGTNKIDSTCTSSLVVTDGISGIDVDFCATHFGHGSNLGRCCLTPDERSMIAGKIAQGVTLSKILDNFRDNIENLFDTKALISKKDLYNIERDFQLVEGKSHTSDFISVRLWIEKMSNDPHNPILFSNLENDIFLVIATDFQLEMLKRFGCEKICIDSTHGTTEYETYLTTIVVVDEFGNGFPTCFCFSKKKDTESWKNYFSKVKEKVGIIKTKVFMTDDDPAFYNAWCIVMGAPEKKLLCSWHVDQAWRKQILSKISGASEKKMYVYKTLKILQHEPHEEEFESLLENICQELLADQETKDFFQYFQATYLNRPEQWAYCYRQRCGINTNMYLEAVHKTLKYFYLKGRKNKRMDLCINALLKFIRDKTFERFIKLCKNKHVAKEEHIEKSHRAAASSNMKIECVSPTAWIVESATLNNVNYEVQKVREKCDEENCRLKCRLCDICYHIFQCECPDFIIRSNICKHIHSILLLNSKEPSRPENPEQFEIDILEKALVNRTEKDADEENRTALVDKLMVAVGLVRTNDYSGDEYADFHKRVDSFLNAIRGNKRKLIDLTNINVEPPNKKIEKQLRFSSSKKQNRVPKLQIQNYTSVREAIEIKKFFTSSSSEILAISSQPSNDHLY